MHSVNDVIIKDTAVQVTKDKIVSNKPNWLSFLNNRILKPLFDILQQTILSKHEGVTCDLELYCDQMKNALKASIDSFFDHEIEETISIWFRNILSQESDVDSKFKLYRFDKFIDQITSCFVDNWESKTLSLKLLADKLGCLVFNESSEYMKIEYNLGAITIVTEVDNLLARLLYEAFGLLCKCMNEMECIVEEIGTKMLAKENNQSGYIENGLDRRLKNLKLIEDLNNARTGVLETIGVSFIVTYFSK
jgi:hypothetical protein